MNSLIEREILPPRPMELYLPPLSRPCLSQSVNIYRICIGSNANLFKRRESAMARAILQSSVHTLVYPNLSCTLSPNFSSRSLNPFLKKGSFLNFSQSSNSVVEPRASPIDSPTKDAIERLQRSDISSYLRLTFLEKSLEYLRRSASSFEIILQLHRQFSGMAQQSLWLKYSFISLRSSILLSQTQLTCSLKFQFVLVLKMKAFMQMIYTPIKQQPNIYSKNLPILTIVQECYKFLILAFDHELFLIDENEQLRREAAIRAYQASLIVDGQSKITIYSNLMKNILLMAVLVPGMSIIFAYTKANIWSFWLGFSLCLVLQFFILVSYCFIKVQKAYRDSFTIKLQENYNMNPKEEYPFAKEFFVNDKFYLNKYTEQAFLNNKKEVLKSPAIDEKLEDLSFNEVSCRKELEEYIQQMRQKYKCLNKFNEALITFGIRIKTISDSALVLKKLYNFAEDETYFKDSTFSNEFRQQERRAFNELKVKLKSPKVSSQGLILGRSGESGNGEEIVLPAWRIILNALEKIGKQFQQIQQMRKSNSQMIEMINRKMFQDYEILEKQMSDTIKNLEEIRQNLANLKDEQKKLDIHETNINNESSSELIYWLKKQYFEFTNLTLRIKQNQNAYKRNMQKMGYYTTKITAFYKQQKEKYDSIVITRYISFLDTYQISLQESLKSLSNVFSQQGYVYNLSDPGPPKVKEMIKSKNMNEILMAEINYHEEYFERVEYYKKKITTILQNLESLDQFLLRLKGIYSELIYNLDISNFISPHQKKLATTSVYFRILYEQLSIQTNRICEIIDNLQKVNRTLQKENQAQLLQMHRMIGIGCQKSHQYLNKLRLKEGPIRQKYKLVKTDLTLVYKEMEQIIGSVKYFEQVYQKHHNRIKKILVVSFIQFINYQKKMICNQGEGDYLRKTAQLAEPNLDDPNPLDVTKIDITEEISYQNQNRLETGYVFSQQYKTLLNRFLFVAYTEWSQSQLFKATIAKEIYIALNEENNESLSQINIEDFQLSGQPPEIIWIKQLFCEQGEFIIDANLSFRGKVCIKISTIYITFISIPIQLEISIEQFYSVMRFCFITNDLGCSWFSFIGEPIAKVIVNPRLGSVQMNFESIVNMFQSMFLKKLKENVYPIKKKIGIPLYKKDESYEIIQNRFKFGME